MMQRLTNSNEIEDASRRIAELLEARGEWFCTGRHRKNDDGTTTALRREEWEVRVSHGSLIFSLWGDSGAQVWRVAGWQWTGEKLRLEVTRRMGAERTTLELVPRATASTALAALIAARRAAAEQLAALVVAQLAPTSKVARVGLSAGARRNEPGRNARIVLRRGQREHIAVTGPIADLRRHEVDAFLSSALIWHTRLGEKEAGRKEGAADFKLWLVVPRDIAEAIAERLALLREALRRVIFLYEIDDSRDTIMPRSVPELRELLDTTSRFRRPPQLIVSETAERVVSLAPEAIDVVRAGHGETLRFHGLAFARVRRVMDRERLWFGTEGAQKRELLQENNWPQLLKLLNELCDHRHAGTDDTRHALYRALPEAWLESLLRRDITRLDPGLIISPLHAQFRTSREAAHAGARPVDLLALRRDGRLVVIELKVSEDASLVLQGADYWRRIEVHRRCEHIARARLFADAVISDEPPLVYLVAPLLRFHRAFNHLARAVSPEIEIYRFDINEDWRARWLNER